MHEGKCYVLWLTQKLIDQHPPPLIHFHQEMSVFAARSLMLPSSFLHFFLVLYFFNEEVVTKNISILYKTTV